MAKKALIERNNKKKNLILKYNDIRLKLKENLKNVNNLNDYLLVHKKLQKLPKNSAQNRFKNRCYETGRARGFNTFFGLSRINLRENYNKGFLPGLIKLN